MARSRHLETFLLEALLVYVALLSVGLGGVHFGWFATLDRMVFDQLTRRFAAPLDARVVIVGIDEQSLNHFGRWPWPRALQAELLEVVGSADANAVLVDIVYAEPGDPVEDARLVAAVERMTDVGLPIIIDANRQHGPLVEVMPFPELISAADRLGHVHVELDPDGLVRGVHFYQGIGEAFWPHLVGAMGALFDASVPERGSSCTAPAYSLQNVRCGYAFTSFVGRPGSIPQVSAEDVLARGEVVALLSGKIVLVGLTATAVADWVTTPVSGAARPMSGVEFNANLLNAVLTSTLRQPVPAGVNFALVIASVSAVVFWLPRLRPRAMLIAAAVIAGLPLAASVIVFVFMGRFMHPAAAMVACFIAYPLWSWRRLDAAWRFVASELDRFAAERDQLGPSETQAEFRRACDFLAVALASDCSGAAIDPFDDNRIERLHIESRGNRILVDFIGPVRLGQLTFSRTDPYSDQELDLARRVLGPFVQGADGGFGPTLERMSAQIDRVRDLGRQVRSVRDRQIQTLDRMSNGVCVGDASNRVLAVNLAFLGMIGKSRESAMGRTLLEVLEDLPAPLGGNWPELVREMLLGDRPISFEAALPGRGTVYLSCSRITVDAEEFPVLLITMVDTGDVELARRQRAEALAFLSHDLRSPILSILALLRTNAHTPDESLLKKVETYAQRSLNTSEQFLQLSRVESQEPFEVYELDLLNAIHNAVDQAFEEAAAKSIVIEMVEPEIAGADGIWLNGNGELIERALLNLLGNAIKYGPDGSRVTVTVSTHSGEVRCSVADQGPGIPAEDRTRLFDPFFRSSHRGLADKRGSGLGLRFVKTVVERHGGRVEAGNGAAGGAFFTVTLPGVKTA